MRYLTLKKRWQCITKCEAIRGVVGVLSLFALESALAQPRIGFLNHLWSCALRSCFDPSTRLRTQHERGCGRGVSFLSVRSELIEREEA